MSDDRLLQAGEAAALVGLKPATLAAWRSRGVRDQPPFVRLGRRAIRYRETAIREWIAARERATRRGRR